MPGGVYGQRDCGDGVVTDADRFRDATERELWATAYSAERKRGAPDVTAEMHANTVLREFRKRSQDAPR